MDPVALLRQIPVLAEVDEAALGRLAQRTVPRTVGPGHLLFRAGDECRGLYVIEWGRVRIFRVSRDGKEQVLHIEGAGRAIAELPLVDGGPYPASAVTLDETRLLYVPRDEFVHLYRSSPDVADAVIRALGRRLRHLVQLTETLAFRDVAARLAMLLATYAEQHGEPTDVGVALALDRTQEELSLEIGTARESVSRAFKQLRSQGLIEQTGGNRLLIGDVAKLRAFARGG
jgi:CRP-like cAMP-binding protein